MGPQIRHVLRLGASRQGKSESCLLENAPVMRQRNRPGMIILDPPGTMADESLAQRERRPRLGACRQPVRGNSPQPAGFLLEDIETRHTATQQRHEPRQQALGELRQ